MTTNSIRLRLRKSDLAALQENKILEDQVTFPSKNSFSFALSMAKNKSIEASFTESQLLISLPIETASHWIESTDVGIETHLRLNEEDSLHILIEKDFPCLDREEENKEDTFWELNHDKANAC